MSRIKLFEDFKNHEETFPSEEFGIATGMDWIFKDWKMPGDPDEIGYYIEKWSDELENKKTADKASDNLIGLYKTILELNPELKGLGEPKSWDNILDFCRGPLSKFNLDDIKFYAELPWNDKVMYNRKNQPIMDEIHKITGTQVQWVMSPTTIERVKKELKMK